MESMSLLPRELPQKLDEGDGGSYYAWNTTVFPLLGPSKVSGGKFILNPRGFALPHYSDCNKIGYVIRGTNGVVGIIYSGSTEEKVVKLQKGDTIVVRSGAVSWWYNAGDEQLEIIFLGESRETANGTNPGVFSYCFVAGAIGVLKGFPNKTLCKAYDISEKQVNELINSQKQPLITLLEEGNIMPKAFEHSQNLTTKFENSLPDIYVEKGGFINSLTSEKNSILKEVELSGRLLKLEPNAMCGPTYYGKDSGVELTYVTKGSGWVQVVGMNGQIALDTQLEVGQIFVVPKFYVVAIGAGNEGIECFSIVTTSRPILGQVAGSKSLWKALSPQVLEASLNVSSDLRKLFIDSISKSSIITPPK